MALPPREKKVHPNYSGGQFSAGAVAADGEEKSSPFVAFPLLPIRTTVAHPIAIGYGLRRRAVGSRGKTGMPARRIPCEGNQTPTPVHPHCGFFSRCSTSAVRPAECSSAAPTALYQKNRVWPWLWLKARRGSNACEWGARTATEGFALRRHVREPCTGEYGEDSTALWCGILIPPKAVSR